MTNNARRDEALSVASGMAPLGVCLRVAVKRSQASSNI